jgi:hypothetical protein
MCMSINGAQKIITKIFVGTLKNNPRVLLKRKNSWRSISEIFRQYF